MKFNTATIFWWIIIGVWLFNVILSTIKGEPWSLVSDWCATVVIIAESIFIILRQSQD